MEKQENLRFEFVEMLFALAIGQVAVDLGDLIFKQVDFFSNPQIYSHLFLATIIITLSWVGWQNSKSHGNILTINSIYSIQFLILLVDLFLVVCYFIIVRGVDFTTSADSQIQPTTDIKIELKWTLILFSTYCVWDILTKLVDFDIYNKNSVYFRKRVINWSAYLKRAWQTWACLGISIALFIYYNKQPLNNWKAFVVDIMLVNLYFIFRGLKALPLEIKKKITIGRNELTEKIITKLALPASSYPITVVDNTYKNKIFLAVVLPSLVFFGCILIFKRI